MSRVSARIAACASARERAPTAPLHVLTWAAWLACASAMIMLTSNPLYITTIGLCGLAVYASHRQRAHRAMDYLLVAGIAIAVLTIPLNLLSGSSGSTVIAHVPTLRLPGWLGSVRFGGALTAESLVFAADRASGIAAMLAVAWAFNASVDHFRLLRHVPAALAQLGIVTTIALLLVPQTVAQAAALREARKVRGYRSSGFTTAVALTIPLLAGGLEQSVQRAESLDARGFGRLASRGRAWETMISGAGLVFAACGAFLFFGSNQRVVAIAMLAAGGIAIAGVLWRVSGRSAAVRLKSVRLAPADRLVLGTSIGAAAIFALARASGSGGLGYSPFPRLEVPAFGAIPVMACVLLLAPALFAATQEAR